MAASNGGMQDGHGSISPPPPHQAPAPRVASPPGKARPRISVVVPMHNARQWIEATLASVLAQTCPAEQLETIIVDDGSSDDSVEVARTFIARTGMRARVITCDRNSGVSAARNVGWRAATGDWIQFLDADDLLAPGKLELQAAMVPDLADDVSVICANWQRLGSFGTDWRPYGEITCPEFDRSVILRIVTINAGFLGPALIRKRSLEAVSGLCESVTFSEDSHLMLKLAAAGGRFVETPTAVPLFFIRQTPGSISRRSWGEIARQHLANLVTAERLLCQQSRELSEDDRSELSRLSGWALSELYEHDRPAFDRHVQWLRERGLAFRPHHTTKLKVASLVLGPAMALWVAARYRRLKVRAYPRIALFAAHPIFDTGLQLCGAH